MYGRVRACTGVFGISKYYGRPYAPVHLRALSRVLNFADVKKFKMLKIVDISSLPHMTFLELGGWVFEETSQ